MNTSKNVRFAIRKKNIIQPVYFLIGLFGYSGFSCKKWILRVLLRVHATEILSDSDRSANVAPTTLKPTNLIFYFVNIMHRIGYVSQNTFYFIFCLKKKSLSGATPLISVPFR